MSTERITYLTNLALANKASAEELEELTEALRNDEAGIVTQEIERLLEKEKTATGQPFNKEMLAGMADNILSADRSSEVPSGTLKKAPVFSMWKKVAAAAVILLVGGGVYYMTTRVSKTGVSQTTPNNTSPQDAPCPGSNKAILTLADGSAIVLDKAANGSISTQGNATISKKTDGQLVYDNTTGGSGHSELIYNTVSTPKGGQYQVLLSDGTKVWLNAVSSLHFPATFPGKERTVELTGEGYFEVAKDASKPFIVKTNELSIEVLGTHFNTNAYNDEADIKVTLLEGSVKVSVVSGQLSVLKPGQQAVFTHSARSPSDNSQLTTHPTAVEEAIAWKEGFFQFSGADLPLIMRQISRWYDVEIIYEGKSKEHDFVGKIDRNIPLSGVVNALKQSGINCRVEQNKLIVSP
jgi:transmembrane sensor